MLGAAIVLVANLLRQPSALPRLGAGLAPLAASGFVTALAQATLFEELDRAPVTVVAPLVGPECSGRSSSPRCSSAAASLSADALSWLASS